MDWTKYIKLRELLQCLFALLSQPTCLYLSLAKPQDNVFTLFQIQKQQRILRSISIKPCLRILNNFHTNKKTWFLCVASGKTIQCFCYVWKYPKYLQLISHKFKPLLCWQRRRRYKEIIKKMFHYFANSILTFRFNIFFSYFRAFFMTGKSCRVGLKYGKTFRYDPQ